MSIVGVVTSVLILTAVTVGVLWWSRAPVALASALAVARGVGQLAVISVVLGVALTYTWAGVAVVVVMFGTAAITARGRLREFPRPLRSAAAAIGAGSVVSLLAVFGAGAFELSTRYWLAFAGIVIGGAMNAASSTGRQLWLGMVARTDEIQGWLALGATPRQAVAGIARAAVAEAMRPAIDQTKTTGLVTLPGAYVGAILAGSSPMDAGVFQVTVLAGLLAARAVASAATAYALGSPQLLPPR